MALILVYFGVESTRNVYPLRKDKSPLKEWSSSTLAVYVTIVVPRPSTRKLRKVLKESDLDITIHGVVTYSRNSSNFYSVSATFGSATQTQSGTGGRVSVALASSNDGIAGDAELVVSFCIPGWMLMRGLSETSVGIQVHMAPSIKFRSIASELGPELLIFGVKLSENSRRVMFSREPPQIDGQQWGMQLAVPPLESSPPSVASLDTVFDAAACSVRTVTAHIPVPAAAKDAWQAKQPVSIQQASPTHLDIVTKDVRFSSPMPLPVDVSTQQSKVARQSMYLEVRHSILLGLVTNRTSHRSSDDACRCPCCRSDRAF